MNFWEFLDRNGEGAVIVLVIALLIIPLAILAWRSDDKAVAPSPAIHALDAGAP